MSSPASPAPSSDAALLDALITIALNAGAEILTIYDTDFDVETKGDGSPVTVADQRAEDIILAGLKQHAPQIPVLAEESASDGDIDAIGKTLGTTFFLVDPLDGTREFANRTGEFTVNIALTRNGRSILGVVYAPVLRKLYAGIVGEGAFLIDLNQETTPRQPISIRPAPAAGLCAVASRSHRSPETDALLETMNVADFAAAGSSLKFCLIAEGKADIYPRLGRTMEWDTGAGQAVLEAAGGCVVVHPGGEPLLYGKASRRFDNPYFIAYGSSD